MEKLREIKNLISVCAANGPKGPYTAGLLIPDADIPYWDNIEQPFFGDFRREGISFDKLMKRGAPKPGVLPEGWIEAVTSPDLSVVYSSQSCPEKILTTARRIYGPAAPKGVSPAEILAWTQWAGLRTSWELKLYQNGEIKTILKSDTLLGTPSVTVYQGRPVMALRMDGNTVVVDEDGGILGRYPLKFPHLCAAGERLYLSGERAEQAKGIRLFLYDITDGANPLIYEASEDEINIGADLCADGDTVYMAFEARPCWGADHCLTMTNAIHVWKLERNVFCPVCRDIMPKEGWLENHGQFEMTIHMGYIRVQMLQGKLTLACRRFNCDGMRRNKWNLCLAVYDGTGRFSPFRMICDAAGPSDTFYQVVEWGRDAAAVMTAYDENDLASEVDSRMEIWRFSLEEELLPLPGPAFSHKAPYQIAYSAANAALEPAPLRIDGYAHLTCDLHTHSAYSKCMSAIDGSPSELLRWHRDIQGNEAVCLTDHLDRVAMPYYIWLTDKLEELAEGAVVIYGNEPSVSPDHDTNFYTVCRQYSDISRLAAIYSVRRSVMYAVLKRYIPEGQIGCFRHAHGRSEIHTLKTLQTWDPALEWNMEALQLRGNIILGESHEIAAQRFPCNFLDYGCKIGLTGGTDHNTAIMNNRFGLTGIWVKAAPDGTVQPEDVLEAMRSRRLTAFSNAKIQLWSDVEGAPMGSEIDAEENAPLSVHFSVSSAFSVERAALMKDGELLEWIDLPGGKSYDGVLVDPKLDSGPHWYTVVVQCGSIFEDACGLKKVSPMMLQGKEGPQARNEHAMAFTSPIFVRPVSA